MTNFDYPTFRNQRTGLIVYGGVPPKSLDTWEQVYVTTEPPSGDQSASSAAVQAVLDLLDRADAKPGPEGERKVNTAAVRAAIDAVVSSEDHVDADTIPTEGTQRDSTNVPPPHANKER